MTTCPFEIYKRSQGSNGLPEHWATSEPYVVSYPVSNLWRNAVYTYSTLPKISRNTTSAHSRFVSRVPKKSYYPEHMPHLYYQNTKGNCMKSVPVIFSVMISTRIYPLHFPIRYFVPTMRSLHPVLFTVPRPIDRCTPFVSCISRNIPNLRLTVIQNDSQLQFTMYKYIVCMFLVLYYQFAIYLIINFVIWHWFKMTITHVNWVLACHIKASIH